MKKWRYLSHLGFDTDRVPYYEWVYDFMLFVAFFLIL